ncbi:tetratricopeptide repeat protein [Chitinophaga sancti]
MALVEKGVAAYDSGYYDKAIPLFDQAIAMDPEYYLAYYEKSLTLFRLERMTECECNYILILNLQRLPNLVLSIYNDCK